MFYLKYLIVILFAVIGVSSELHDIEDMKLLYFTQIENVKKSIDILKLRIDNLSEKNSDSNCNNKLSSQILENFDDVKKSLEALMNDKSEKDKFQNYEISRELETFKLQEREKQIQRITDLERNYATLIELLNTIKKSEERLIEKNIDLVAKYLDVSKEGESRTNSINKLNETVESLKQQNSDLEAKYSELLKLYENITNENGILKKRLYVLAEHESDMLSNLEELKSFEQNQTIFDIRVDELPNLKKSCVKETTPIDCAAATKCTKRSGYYKIFAPGNKTQQIMVYCDTKTNGGNWLHIVRRHNSEENFPLPWSDYVNGFGDVESDYWLGLENLHALTNNNGQQELYIYLENTEGETRYAHYDNFVVGNATEFYELKSVGACNGTAGDIMAYNVGFKFSTIDVDNDVWKNKSCAKRNGAGWWYGECTEFLATGKYLDKIMYLMTRKVRN